VGRAAWTLPPIGTLVLARRRRNCDARPYFRPAHAAATVVSPPRRGRPGVAGHDRPGSATPRRALRRRVRPTKRRGHPCSEHRQPVVDLCRANLGWLARSPTSAHRVYTPSSAASESRRLRERHHTHTSEPALSVWRSPGVGSTPRSESVGPIGVAGVSIRRDAQDDPPSTPARLLHTRGRETACARA